MTFVSVVVVVNVDVSVDVVVSDDVVVDGNGNVNGVTQDCAFCVLIRKTRQPPSLESIF